MAIYIKGVGNISPQPAEGGLTRAVSHTGHRLICQEPDYAPWIAPPQQRRMSRIIKMGVTSALMALKEAGIAKPDAIITGTGLGCLQDTGQFLAQMIANKEIALNPTPFIQSTHNTIGSQIALLLQVQGYNQTYAHDASSFESALIDALLQVADNPGQNLLVGGIDEITDYSYRIQSRFGLYKKNPDDTGAWMGEGVTWFVVTGIPLAGAACVESAATYFRLSPSEAAQKVDEFLAAAGIRKEEIDLLLLGKSGRDRAFEKTEALFPKSSIGGYKHLCGEYPVSSAFALSLATEITRTKQIPEIVLTRDKGRVPLRTLIYNQYFGMHHSLILVKAC